MLEVFKYTNRVVNMVRPRKLLFMAIGVYAFIFIHVPRPHSPRWCGSPCKDESATLASFQVCSRSKGQGRSPQTGSR